MPGSVPCRGCPGTLLSRLSKYLLSTTHQRVEGIPGVLLGLVGGLRAVDMRGNRDGLREAGCVFLRAMGLGVLGIHETCHGGDGGYVHLQVPLVSTQGVIPCGIPPSKEERIPRPCVQTLAREGTWGNVMDSGSRHRWAHGGPLRGSPGTLVGLLCCQNELCPLSRHTPRQISWYSTYVASPTHPTRPACHTNVY